MMYGFIYETTNNVNGKKYIGSHKRSQDLEDPDDSWYLGSGKLLWQAIRKYGIENFSRVILFDCATQEEMEEAETRVLLERDAANDPNYYNLMPSYFGGTIAGVNHPRYNKHHTEETKRLIGLHSGATRKGKPLTESQRRKITEHLRSPENRQRQSTLLRGTIAINNGALEKRVTFSELENYLEQGWVKGRLNLEVSPIFKDYWKGKKQSDETIQKRSSSLSGRVVLHKGEEFIRVNPEIVDSYISEGWSLGMPESFSEMRSKDVSGKVHIYKCEEQKFIYPHELDTYLSDGWSRGLPQSQRDKLSKSKLGDKNPARRDDVKDKIRKANSGRIWVQNGIDRVYIYPEELENYLAKGYVRGKKLKNLQ